MYERTYYTYIMGSFRGVLYVGITNDIERRVYEHKTGYNKGFTKKYRCKHLLYYEEYDMALDAIAREKQIKKYRREKKERLIRSMNPHWQDLAEDWFDDLPSGGQPLSPLLAYEGVIPNPAEGGREGSHSCNRIAP